MDLPELRAELLETAQEYLDDQHKLKRKFGEIAFEDAVKAVKKLVLPILFSPITSVNSFRSISKSLKFL